MATLHSLFCLSSTFPDGRLVSVNDTNVTQFGSLPQGSVFIANLTCPDNATSFDDCPDPGYTFNPQCYEPERNYIVECYSRGERFYAFSPFHSLFSISTSMPSAAISELH